LSFQCALHPAVIIVAGVTRTLRVKHEPIGILKTIKARLDIIPNFPGHCWVSLLPTDLLHPIPCVQIGKQTVFAEAVKEFRQDNARRPRIVDGRGFEDIWRYGVLTEHNGTLIRQISR
jgi:hypothetical protein